ncbi:hypothetical protein [Haloferax sp. Atlit-4N]|uniref:hypothetical protein n=1 Tax=Haloferax sp. Atlit-4N TaxID=2077206 RepID=UPI0018F5F9B4|nr:hypothetical protein [Haloferax sp. Atlit-4N]
MGTSVTILSGTAATQSDDKREGDRGNGDVLLAADTADERLFVNIGLINASDAGDVESFEQSGTPSRDNPYVQADATTTGERKNTQSSLQRLIRFE